MLLDLDLEDWPGSPVIRRAGSGYGRVPAAAHRDAPARLTSRQGVFYRNLIRMAEAVGGRTIPVDFDLPTGERLYLDRGCVKIAELAGFIRPLEDDEGGVVSEITLSWNA